MLAADEPGLVDGLLLFSYRFTRHASRRNFVPRISLKLHTPVVFVHGTRNPLESGSAGARIAEWFAAAHLINRRNRVISYISP
jgi:predicted alpha/beta-hydrolase family hydrolase